MKERGLDLLNYHHWANLKLLSHINSFSENIFHKQLQNVFPSIDDTFFHIYKVDHLWLTRCNPNLILNENISDFKDIATAENSFRELHKVGVEYITDHYDELNKITYQNSTGTTYTNNINEIIHHVVNHGTYHRGNIASMIRQLGFNGTSTDYIEFLRNV